MPKIAAIEYGNTTANCRVQRPIYECRRLSILQLHGGLKRCLSLSAPEYQRIELTIRSGTVESYWIIGDEKIRLECGPLVSGAAPHVFLGLGCARG